jgi:prepilin peptidase CpaA
MHPLALLTLISLLVAATASDLRRHRIPNWVSLGGVLIALTLQTISAGPSGLGFALGGIAIGFALFVVPYAFSLTGAGDVKLMMMVGGFLGWHDTLEAALFALVIGGIMGVAVVTLRNGLIPLVQRYAAMVLALAARQPMYLAPQEGDAARARFPYALAIALGTLVALYRNDSLPF